MTSKISGIMPPPPKTEIDGIIENLHNKTIFEMKEILARQEKLLGNKAFISKLKDKGEKIRILRDKVLQEISDKTSTDKTSDLLASLSIADIEWKKPGKTDNGSLQLDSDDDADDEDPLRIIAQSTHNIKLVKVLPKEKSLITEADINQGNLVTDEHTQYICKKTSYDNEQRIKFKPFKMTKSNVHDPSKEKLRKKHKFWEVTAATPPPIEHGPVKTLSLQESLALQNQYTKLMKDVQAKHASEKLATQLNLKIGEIPKSLLDYRNNESDTESDTSETNKIEPNSDDEVHDEEYPDGGGVVFTVMK